MVQLKESCMHSKLGINIFKTNIMLLKSQRKDKPCNMYNNEPLETWFGSIDKLEDEKNLKHDHNKTRFLENVRIWKCHGCVVGISVSLDVIRRAEWGVPSENQMRRTRWRPSESRMKKTQHVSDDMTHLMIGHIWKYVLSKPMGATFVNSPKVILV